MNNAKGVYIDAKTFISNYYHVDIDQLISNKLSEKENVFQLKDLLECFDDENCKDLEINQKDCYWCLPKNVFVLWVKHLIYNFLKYIQTLLRLHSKLLFILVCFYVDFNEIIIVSLFRLSPDLH